MREDGYEKWRADTWIGDVLLVTEALHSTQVPALVVVKFADEYRIEGEEMEMRVQVVSGAAKAEERIRQDEEPAAASRGSRVWISHDG